MVKTQFKKKYCSPKKNKLNYSCLSKTALKKIAISLNKIEGISINYKSLSDKQLYDTLCDIMKNNFKCNNEPCWLNIRKLMNNLGGKEVNYLRMYFKPHMPKEIISDYTKWISNFDIESVMNQYNDELDDVYSYGAVPIDFNKCSVSSDLCKFNLKDHINKGETKLIMIFNTDNSSGPGKHWNSAYVDVRGNNLNGQPGIYFFDSFAAKPLKEVKDLFNTIKKQGKKNNIDFIVSINDKKFQNNTFSCGFYCMHFLENMIKGVSFNKYLNSGLSDKKMIKYRNHCYLNPEEIKC